MSIGKSGPFRQGAALLLVGALIAGAAVIADAGGLLFLAPALLLVSVLLMRRYPGERLLRRFAARPRRHCNRTGRLAHRPTSRRASRPRGGLLLGFSLAVRPPPPSPRAS